MITTIFHAVINSYYNGLPLWTNMTW